MENDEQKNMNLNLANDDTSTNVFNLEYNIMIIGQQGKNITNNFLLFM